jgi:hypothetical protein
VDEIVAAFTSALAAAVPTLVGAAVVAVLAWIKWLTQRAHVRAEVTASAVRQAQLANGGDTPAAAQAAVDELLKMSAKVRPADPAQAVVNAVDLDRLKRASKAPPIDLRAPDEDGE